MEGRPARRRAEIRTAVSRLDRDRPGKITGEERMFEGEFGRIRDVNVAPDGSIWLLTDESRRRDRPDVAGRLKAAPDIQPSAVTAGPPDDAGLSA